MKPWIILSMVKRPVIISDAGSRLKLIMSLTLALLFCVMINNNMRIHTFAKSYLLDGTSFIQDMCQQPQKFMRRIVGSFYQHIDSVERIRKLEIENHALRSRYYHAAALASENDRLREKLRVVKEMTPEFISVRVMGGSESPYQNNLHLGAGRRAGIQIKSAVLLDRHIIGRVIEVGNYSCRVLLLTDAQSHIPVVLEKSGLQGILSGNNSNELKIKMIRNIPLSELEFSHSEDGLSSSLPPHSQNQISKVVKGEYVFSSGQGGIFPPGFLVGRVREVTSQDIIVESIMDISQMEYVQVAQPFDDRTYED